MCCVVGCIMIFVRMFDWLFCCLCGEVLFEFVVVVGLEVDVFEYCVFVVGW